MDSTCVVTKGDHTQGANLLNHVNELIFPITGGWDERLTRDTFLPKDARHILQIPLREGGWFFRMAF
jgi:hypothetical protein